MTWARPGASAQSSLLGSRGEPFCTGHAPGWRSPTAVPIPIARTWPGNRRCCA